MHITWEISDLFGTALFIPAAVRNLVSLGVITKHLHVSFRSGPPHGSATKKPGCYKVKITPGKFIEFVQDERDQDSFKFPHSWTHAKFSSPLIADDRHNQEVLVAVSVYNSEFPSHFVMFIRVHSMFYLFIYLRILLLICIDHIYLHHSLVSTCA